MVGESTGSDDTASGFCRLRQPEVEHLHRAIGSQLDVRWLQVPVDDPLLVSGFEGLGDLLRDRQCLVDWNRALCDSVGERRPLDQFHDERRHAVALLEAVDVRDVRMVQRREDFGFALEPRQPLGVCRNGLRQDLDRDLPLQVRVSSAIHLAHAADADLGGDFIRAEAGASSQSHGKWLRL